VWPDRGTFNQLAARGNLVPLVRRIFGDQITPVLGYRRLVSADQRTAPSFLFESVETGGRAGRYSYFGAQPALEVVAAEREVTVRDHVRGSVRRIQSRDPLAELAGLSSGWTLAVAAPRERSPLPAAFRGGWVGYAAYDAVRWLEPGSLPFAGAPPDDRALPILHFGLYREIVVVDHVEKSAAAIVHVECPDGESLDGLYDRGCAALERLVERLESHRVPLPSGSIDMDLGARSDAPATERFPRERFEAAVRQAKEYIAAGDAFQIVLSRRIDRQTRADPFEIYRALRVVNPSPYQIYLQAEGVILVASSPEILCRVEGQVVINRPLAGTRRRSPDPQEDERLEQELREDAKERSEHVMLVDLGRNDLGRVSRPGGVSIERCMDVERYSHVMHLSSTVTGRLRPGLCAWDALRATLPVGTVSGAPKVRAMQIIDELEPLRRGPYAGGIGAVGFSGDMDIALALRTLVIPTRPPAGPAEADGPTPRTWAVHLQAGAGIVADSDPAAEWEETSSKAAALARAIDLAEAAFVDSPRDGRLAPERSADHQEGVP
jgi:anthranilate synthase component 1